MFYSTHLNLLFIAAPKTGSTSVEAYLLDLDDEGERFVVTLADRVIDSRAVNTSSLRHATASELRDALGRELFESMVTFGFVRDPIEKIVSTYFFSRKGSIKGVFKIRSAKSRWPIIGKRLASMMLARLLPFSLWALVFPMKKCSAYFLDAEGNVIVDYLGSTDRLGDDLSRILEANGVASEEVSVPHLNRTKHRESSEYIEKTGRLHKYLAKRYADDIMLYEKVKDDIFDAAKSSIPVID